ncbi:MAG: hypothetical protein WCF95_00115 [bacterium]|jgi:hypothetical protein
MFVRKTRQFLEFAFILVIVCVLSYFMMRIVNSIKFFKSDLDFNPDMDTNVESLLDEN